MKLKQTLSIILSLALLLGLLLLGSLPTTAADNLAANGDLETGNANGWEIADAAVDSSVKYAGNYSLKLTATSAYSGAAYKIVPVGKGATVTVSFYYRYASNPGSGKTYHVYTYQGTDASVGAYSNADATLTIPTGCDSISTWKQVSYSFNSGNYANIYLKFCPGGNGSSTCYIDNLVVTATGGTQEKVAPYLTSFGTKYNRPNTASANLIRNGGFESADNAPWNTPTFIRSGVSVVVDSTTREGGKSLYFASSDATTAYFPVSVEQYTQYTFSAWVKSPRLSADNNATATFGVADADTGEFLVYEPYNGDGHGSATISTPAMQLMATSPDDAWHLRSVTFYSGSADTVYIMVSGAHSRLYLDDIALYKSANGLEYISDLRTATISWATNSGYKYCADEDTLIPEPHMTGQTAQKYWSDNPAWRNGFLSFAEVEDDHATVLKYTASARTDRALWYIDWIDVQPYTDYTLTLDVKRLATGNGRIVLLDDDYDSPKEFYSIAFSTVDSDWKTYSVTFNTATYSRIGFAVVDGGGAAYMDKIRLFKTVDGIATEPADAAKPTLLPRGGFTSIAEMEGAANCITDGDFESGSLAGYDVYQSTVLEAQAAYSGNYGARLRGDGSWGALLEQLSIPVVDGGTYTLSYWYKANAGGTNITLKGKTTDTQYAYMWAADSVWTYVTAEFVVEGDTELELNACGGGNGVAEDVYLDDITLKNIDEIRLGVAFLFELEADGVRMDEKHAGNLDYAKVDAYGDGTRYPLKQMGAVMTNDASIGEKNSEFTLEHPAIGGGNVVDIPAENLFSVSDTAASYAVRVINLPWSYRDAFLYARPYYIFDKDGEEIVVYGSIYHRSYTDANGSTQF